MWNRIRELTTRCFPVVLLLGIAHAFGTISDRAAALAFTSQRDEAHLDAIHQGRRALALIAFEIQSDQLQEAARAARRSSDTVLWLLAAGSIGYLLFARETWRFRLSMSGLIFIASLAQLFYYPLY